MRPTPAALADQPLLLYEAGGNTRQIIDRWFARGGRSPKPVMELGSVEAIKQLVGAGLGWAYKRAGRLQRAEIFRALRPRPASCGAAAN